MSNNSTNTSSLALLNNGFLYAQLVMAVVGILTNAISVYIFTRPQMKSSINVLLTGLSATDLALCLITIPVFIIPSIIPAGEVDLYDDYVYPLTLKFAYPFCLFTQTTSIWLMVLITVERWIAVCYPLQARSWCTMKKSRLGLALMIGLALCYNLIRFWEYQLSPCEGPDANASFCITYTGTLKVEPLYLILYDGLAYLVCQFILPFILLLIFNGQMVKTILRVRRNSRDLSRQEKGEHKTAVMMIVVIIIFLATNTTPILLNFASAVAHNESEVFVNPMFNAVLNASNLLVVVNSATTFVIYWFFSQRYRRIFQVTFRLCLPRSCLPSPEELAFGVRSGASYAGNTAFSRLTVPPQGDGSPGSRRNTNVAMGPGSRRPSDADTSRGLLGTYRSLAPTHSSRDAAEEELRPMGPPTFGPQASHLPRPQNAVEWMSCL